MADDDVPLMVLTTTPPKPAAKGVDDETPLSILTPSPPQRPNPRVLSRGTPPSATDGRQPQKLVAGGVKRTSSANNVSNVRTSVGNSVSNVSNVRASVGSTVSSVRSSVGSNVSGPAGPRVDVVGSSSSSSSSGSSSGEEDDEDAPLAKRPRPDDNDDDDDEAPLGSQRDQADEDEGEDDDAPLGGTKRAAPRRTSVPGRKLERQQTNEEAFLDDGGAVKARARSSKEAVVAKLLSRWWFMDEYRETDWPPSDPAFYEGRMAEQKLRKVSIEEWEWAPEMDGAGKRKVYEMSQFRGLFRNSTGDLVDLRPKDTCPCQNMFMQKDIKKLCGMLINAYENQLGEVQECRYKKQAEVITNDLKSQITKTRNLLAELQSKL